MPPFLAGVTLNGATLTAAAVISYTVTFSEAVTGVTAGSFFLNPVGTDRAASIAGVSGSGATYVVTVNTGGAGQNGTIELDVAGSAVRNLTNIPLPHGCLPATPDSGGGEQPARRRAGRPQR